MCAPWVIPLAAGALQAFGQAKQGQEANATGERNARLGELQAQDTLARGNIDEERYLRYVAQVTGGQKAAFGQRNVKRSGTAIDLLADTEQVGGENALTIRNDAAREAWGLRVGAADDRRYGRAARPQSQYAAGGSLLTGAAQSYGMWKQA